VSTDERDFLTVGARMNRRSFVLGAGLAPVLAASPQAAPTPAAPFRVDASGLSLAFDFLEGRLRNQFLLPAGVEPPAGMPPLGETAGLDVAIHCSGENRKDHHGYKATGSMPGGRLVFAGRRDSPTDQGRRMILEQHDPVLGLRVESIYDFLDGIPVIRRFTRVTNEGAASVGLEYVSSAMLHNFGTTTPADMERDLFIHYAHSSWCSEGQWRRVRPSQLGMIHNRAFHLRPVEFSNMGSWSSMNYLPMGMVENETAGVIWFWQIEHCGSWHWELANTSQKTWYAYIGGPDEAHAHAWKNLAPGSVYETVPVALGCVQGGFEQALSALTQYRRRACLRPHPDNRKCPVIFNDYMNCLSGDPTTAKELPLIDAAAEAGCEYYVIDAGWYAEREESWWDAVGAWQPSRTRWPDGGLAAVLQRIRAKGMVPGLWLEIEVAGLRSPLASKPDDWFFRRHGKRVIDNSRYLLDFRNPAVRAHADEVVNRLVGQYGAGYIKMDFNVTAGLGTEWRADSFGQGLLEHQRALLGWYDALLARHPQLVIENCASGGGRMDYAMLSRLQLQSASDMTEYQQFPFVLAGALTAVLPEQLAAWSYPLTDSTADEASFNMVNVMLCRILQSGHLARLNPDSLAQVKRGIRVYKETIRPVLPSLVPFYPRGTPNWVDEESPLVLGMRGPRESFVAVWRLRGNESTVRLPGVRHARLLYPSDLGISVKEEAGAEAVTFPRPYMAALLHIVD
jgi:alpha-galactosidase